MANHDEMLDQAQRLKDTLEARDLRPRNGRYALAACQEVLARTLGAAHWHEAHKNAQGVSLQTAKRQRSEPRSPGWSSAPRSTGRRVPRPNREPWSRWPTPHLLEHTLLMGSAGSGRTSALKTLALTARDASRGMIWINAGPDLSVKPFLDQHNVGRLGGVQHLNFIRVSSHETQRFNPAAWMTPDDLIAWLEALGQGRLAGPEGWGRAGWHERAVRVWAAVVPILARRRDADGTPLTFDRLINSITWEGLRNLWGAPDLRDDERARLHDYIVPWLTSSDAETLAAPVATAWKQVLGTLHTIGPHMDGLNATLGETAAGNLYRVIEQRETLLVSLPHRWDSATDPRALAYDAFLLALAQVLRTRGPGLRSLDPSYPLPWRMTLVLDNAPGMERFDTDVLTHARQRGVAVAMSYQDPSAARRAGVNDALLRACQTVIQLRLDDLDPVLPDVAVPSSSDQGWVLDLKDQRNGEARVKSPSGETWVAFEDPNRW